MRSRTSSTPTQLRRQPDRQREREQERVDKGPGEGEIDHEDHDQEHRRRADEHESEAVQPLLEAGPRGRVSQSLRDAPELGLRAGVDHEGLGGAADDVSAREEAVRAQGERRLLGDDAAFLLDRIRLAGQHGLVDEQVLRLEDESIAGHEIPGVEHDEVARNDFLEGDGDDPTLAPHFHLGAHEPSQRLDRVGCAVLPPETEQPAEQDDREDDPRVDRVTQEECEQAREGEDQDDRVLELPDEQAQRPFPSASFEPVAADTLEPRSSFLGAEPVRAAGERTQHIPGGPIPVGRRRVPVGRGGILKHHRGDQPLRRAAFASSTRPAGRRASTTTIRSWAASRGAVPKSTLTGPT